MEARVAFCLAMAGTGVIVLAVVYAGLTYRGRTGERFSLLNHFISELGELGVSRGAWVFNGSLVLAGLLFLPFSVHLGLVLDSILGWVGAFFTTAASLGAAAVGIFPMNTLKRHVPAAITFFYGGLAMALTVGLAVVTQPAGRVVVPKIASLLSLVAALSFVSFLTLPRIVMRGADPVAQLNLQVMPERPRFWILPFMEWQVFFSALFWLFCMALFVPGR